MSIFSKNCRQFVSDNSIEIIPTWTSVKTAGGKQHRILGKVNVDIEFKGLKQQVSLYLCPDLEQELYLGDDFARHFKIIPDVLNLDELNIENIQQDFVDNKEHRMKPHDLDENQQNQLEDVIKCFESFEEKGLGRTSLEKHSIKLVEGAVPVKDKYYPISPAVQ